MPIHWSDETASSARVGDLVAADTDPFSGQPEAKATPAAIARIDFAFEGFALARRPLPCRATHGGRGSRLRRATATCSLPTTARCAGMRARPSCSARTPCSRNTPIAAAASIARQPFSAGELAGCIFLHRAGTPALADASSQGFAAIAAARKPAGHLRLLRRRARNHSRGDGRAVGAGRRGDRPRRCAPGPDADRACRN